MQHQRGDRRGARGGDRAHGGPQLRGTVAQEGDHRRHQHPAPDAVLAQRPYDVQAPLRCGRTRLHRAPQLRVGEADRDRDADVRHRGGLPEQVEVAQDQRALRQDREGVRVVAGRRGCPASAGSGPPRAGSGRRWCPSLCGRRSSGASPAGGSAAPGRSPGSSSGGDRGLLWPTERPVPACRSPMKWHRRAMSPTPLSTRAVQRQTAVNRFHSASPCGTRRCQVSEASRPSVALCETDGGQGGDRPENGGRL